MKDNYVPINQLQSNHIIFQGGYDFSRGDFVTTLVGSRFKTDDHRTDIILTQGDSRPGFSGGPYIATDENLQNPVLVGVHLGTVTALIEKVEGISADNYTCQYGHLFYKVQKNL